MHFLESLYSRLASVRVVWARFPLSDGVNVGVKTGLQSCVGQKAAGCEVQYGTGRHEYPTKHDEPA